MAKSLRSKVKKRHRTVKRGVLKRSQMIPGTAQFDGEASKAKKTQEALSGHIEPGKKFKNWFRSDDPDAIIPQHSWRQGPDFRSGTVGEDAGLAVWGTERPKLKGGGYASEHRPAPAAGATRVGGPRDAGLERLMRTAEQIVPVMASKRAKRRAKMGTGVEFGTKGLKWV